MENKNETIPKESKKRKSKKGKIEDIDILDNSKTNEVDKSDAGKDTDEVINGIDESLPSTSAIKSPANNILPDFHKYMKNLMLQQPKKEFQFWKTQPVPSIDENTDITTNEFIEADKSTTSLRQEPYNLPPGFKWDTLDLNDAEVLESLYVLLNENYVEDDDNMFRFDYSKDFLRWALMPPGWRQMWHVGVRVTKTNKLLGFISAIPANIRVFDKCKEMVEINFLCVHKKLRSKRLAPVLIKEITRRVNLTGIFQAVYTAGVVLPRPVASCRYWHRSLNPKKLIDVKFSYLGKNMTMQRTLKLFRLPTEYQTKGFQKVAEEDMAECHKLVEKYLKSYDLTPSFSEAEFDHWFLPKENIIDSYCVKNDGRITDFVSFYTLPSTVMRHPTYKSLKAAYSFYNVSTATPWKILMKDALIAAKNTDFDVFNALDLMENEKFLQELKFGQGDGNLQYYLYNWRCAQLTPQRVGLVLQ